MRLAKKIVDFYVFGNIHVAIAGFCITKITLIEFGIAESFVPSFVALSIIISYNFIRFYEIKVNKRNWFKSWFLTCKKSLKILVVLSASGLIYIVFFTNFNFKSFFILFPFAFMTFFYVIPIFKIGELEFSFRYFPSIKIVSIALAWAGISVLFPLYESDIQYNNLVYITFVQRFFILIGITIPFDIRDVFTDEKSLKTIPQISGVLTTKIIGTLVLVLVIIAEIFKTTYSKSGILILAIIVLLTAIFLWFSTPKRNRFYTSFWVESIPIIWLILIVLLK